MPAPQPVRVLGDTALGVLVGTLALSTSRLADFDDRRGGGPRHPRAAPGPSEPLHPFDGAQLGAVVALVGALAIRRSAPRAGYLGAVGAMALFLLAGGPYGPVLLGPALAVHALMTRLPPRQWAPLLAAVPATLSAGFWTEPWVGLTDPGLYLAVVLGSAGILLPGLVALVLAARHDARRQELVAERRRHAYEERLQIAREVHDVVGHSLAVINLQAGVALHVLDKRPDQLSPSLEAIRATSKTALAELSSTLATFRGDVPPAGSSSGEIGRPSATGLSGLDGLVTALRAAGRTVHLVAPPADPLPLAVEHAALRIAQEGLTNVVRHASPDAAITLALSRQGPALVVEVLDDGRPGPGPQVDGSGITGMRERARAVGGTVQVGPREGGGFRVRAELPADGGGSGG